ncbi:hypothetical protein N0V93_008471 [Gnomoniopsis smithogilvyi]|uniref:Uncharacterized protein n=1 Tax=Gnomoniopsis smithogilvyi TaxID=1191159 RepID=A0A9W8YN17_9PEZI|nr:hypothetical protein N0V93_008471 [Gnomoniopsis smithogilvyi]
MDSTTTASDEMNASLGLLPDCREDIPRSAAEHSKKWPQPKPKPRKSKTKPPKVAPLPAFVHIRGYEITIPNTKTCWRVSMVHSCGHQVMEVSQVRYPGCDKPLVVEINRHMRPCEEKCKVEAISYTVDGLCGMCRQGKENEEDQTSSSGDGNGVGPENLWHGLPQI